MHSVVHIPKLIEIFCSCDDFCILLQRLQESRLADKPFRKPTREPELTPSEMMTIIIFYHLSGFKCFEYYYRKLVLGPLHSYFPQAVSYERFVALMPRCLPLLCLYVCMAVAMWGADRCLLCSCRYAIIDVFTRIEYLPGGRTEENLLPDGSLGSSCFWSSINSGK